MSESPNGKNEPRGFADDPTDAAYEHMSPGQYLRTRLSTLKPPMHKAPNPISLLAMLNFQQWMFFLVCAPNLEHDAPSDLKNATLTAILGGIPWLVLGRL